MCGPFAQTADKKIRIAVAIQALPKRASGLKWLTLSALLLLSGIYSFSAMAQPKTEVRSLYAIESAAASSGLLLDIVRAGERLVVVGDRGHILYSEDNGQHWLQARVPTQQLLTAVYFVDDSYGWAVGHDALILATRDGGVSWTRQYDNLEQESPLLDIWFKDRKQGYAVGAYGQFLETHNGGQDWQRIDERLDNEDGYHLNAINAITDAGIVIVGEAGVIFRSTDWGRSWETLESPYAGSLFGIIALQQPNHLVVYGLRGHVYRSQDFGETWQDIKVATDNGYLQFGLAGSSHLPEGDLVIVGHGGSILRSSDGGVSFSIENRADRASLAGVVAGAQGGLILVGQYGVQHTEPRQ